MEKTQFMYLDGTVMDCQLNGKLKNNTKKIKKIKMMCLLLSLEKNVEILQVNGLIFIKINLKD